MRTSRAPDIARSRWSLRQVQSLVVVFAFGIGCMAISCALVVVQQTISVGSNFLVVVITPFNPMSTKSPECWASDPNARAVKIEVSAEQSLLLPFDQFAFAELKSDGKEQRLRLVFATHEVTLCGHSLRRIETTMQRMELAYLAALPGNTRSLVADGQPAIREVIVTEAKTSEVQPE